jgi:NADP-dependent alcohol dehydrogenase
MDAVALARQERIDFILAVGGGSVIDGSKFIAAAVNFDGGPGADPWDIVAKGAAIKTALPLGCVLTLPAAGSEGNMSAVISRRSTQEKFGFGHRLLYPQFAILDPETTMTLPPKQTRNGIVDAYVHVLEQYVTYPVNTPLQDRQAEGILLTLMEEGPKVLSQPKDYDARANVMWAATQACAGLFAVGAVVDWSTHCIAHELTALYGLDHAETLAIVLPSLLRHQKAQKAAKLEQYARRVHQVTTAAPEAAIEEGIARTVRFFESLDMPTRFAAYGIDPEEAAGRVAQRFAERHVKCGERGDIGPEQTAAILRQG